MVELHGHRSIAKQTDDGHSVELETSSRAPFYLCMKCMKLLILQSFTVEPPLPLLFPSQTKSTNKHHPWNPSLSAWGVLTSVGGNGPCGHRDTLPYHPRMRRDACASPVPDAKWSESLT
jgi:hypothetical protein